MSKLNIPNPPYLKRVNLGYKYRLYLTIKQQSNKKSDLYHKISKTLTDKFESIAVEDLKIKNMSKSSKGDELQHGKNIKQKSGLNRSILSNSDSLEFAS